MVSRYELHYEPPYEGRYGGTKGFASKDKFGGTKQCVIERDTFSKINLCFPKESILGAIVVELQTAS